MPPKLFHEGAGQGTAVADAEVRLDVLELPHPWNHGADVRMLKDVPEGQLRHGHPVRDDGAEALSGLPRAVFRAN